MLGEVATAVVLDWLICWPVVKLFPPKTIICGPLDTFPVKIKSEFLRI
jgi:hypothetical protein